MRTSTLPPAGLAAVLVLAAALLATPQGGEGQELRISGNQGFPALDEVGSPQGWGFGLRYLHGNIGVGVERDLYRSSRVVTRFVCDAGGGGCAQEPVAFDSDLDFTTLMALFQLGRGEDWGLRLGFGRSAGRLTATGVGEESGRRLDPIPADAGNGDFAWSRGADGTVILIELHRTLPLPGPLPLQAMAAYRFHQVEMSGCESGQFSPFCGSLGMNELHLGLVLGLRPRSTP